ncbi:recombinase family protein [Novosphingobium beihaiensis]|uniref:Recombinase family protein n=1 Tax=Novosphingobium beihaiensis TaxID=2930389 RepID=A0ABT0BS57_9SPHN|nr:recombinase family protein [Novosphingobium beihaiensis]MCJ2187903.1 recombinase family protein [Novosphingobium beihaiensis]
MIVDKKRKAVLYCRISDKSQTGLGSQEHRCRQYADAKQYDVVEVFYDKVTGGGDFMKREGMVKLLRFLDDHPEENFVVIFDDLRRYARDTEFHLKLRRMMKERGATRECLNFNFDDTPEGRFNETINAAVGELDRETIARQSRQKQIARLEAGYAVYSRPPVGYKYVKAQHGRNKVLVPSEHAPIVKEALEGFASRRFETQVEVANFLNAHPGFPKHAPGGTVRKGKVFDMLTQPLYAGYVVSKELGVTMRDGKHEGLISKATFAKNQERLTSRKKAAARRDLNRGFVLRGAVSCASCGGHLKERAATTTASQSHAPRSRANSRNCCKVFSLPGTS